MRFRAESAGETQVRGYGLLEIRRVAVPTGTTAVTVIVNAYLGPNETSSLYVDDFELAKFHKNESAPFVSRVR